MGGLPEERKIVSGPIDSVKLGLGDVFLSGEAWEQSLRGSPVAEVE